MRIHIGDEKASVLLPHSIRAKAFFYHALASAFALLFLTLLLRYIKSDSVFLENMLQSRHAALSDVHELLLVSEEGDAILERTFRLGPEDSKYLRNAAERFKEEQSKAEMLSAALVRRSETETFKNSGGGKNHFLWERDGRAVRLNVPPPPSHLRTAAEEIRSGTAEFFQYGKKMIQALEDGHKRKSANASSGMPVFLTQAGRYLAEAERVHFLAEENIENLLVSIRKETAERRAVISRTEKAHLFFAGFYLLALFLFLLGLSLFFVTREFVKPIETLAAQTREIGAGRIFLEVPVRRNDEIGHLGAAFNSMLAHLKEIMVSRMDLLKEIEERKKTAEALKESEAFSRSIIESAHDAFISIDCRGVIRDWNRKAETLFGWKREEAVGKALVDFIVPTRMREAYLTEVRQVGDMPEHSIAGRTIERFVANKSGHEFPAEITVWTAGSGAISCFNAFLHDISERKARQEELVKLSSIVRQSAEAVAVTDRQGVIEYVNPTFEKLTGYTREEAVGQSSRLLRSGRHPREFYENLWSTVLRGETFRATLWNKRKNGTFYYEEKIITPIRDAEGNIVHFVSTGRDVTKQVQMQEHLKKANEELQKTNEELRLTQLHLIEAAKMETVGQLAAGVAHEVKNPLGILQFAVDGLRLQCDEKQMTEAEPLLADMTEAIRRADSVIKGLLNFSRTSEMNLAEVSINEVLERTLLLLKHDFLRLHVTLETKFGENLPKARIDANKMEQVFLNILMNAAQAMENQGGGTLTVKTSLEKMDIPLGGVGSRKEDRFRPGETALHIEICDTGPGIPEEHLKKLFDPFFTTKPAGKGTGLGLFVTRKIVDLNRGLIRITNRAEGGARVQLFFPIPKKEDHAA